MKLRFAPLLFLIALPTSVVAQDCPAALDTGPQAAKIYEKIQAAENEMTARALAAGLWDLWKTAPDAHAQELLDRGFAAHAAYDFDAAKEAYDALIQYCPDYAEGYNQRAYVAYLRGDFASALDDLERTVEINPTHVAALAGQALTLMRLGRMEVAQSILRDALALNPWLSERAFLIEEKEDDKIEL